MKNPLRTLLSFWQMSGKMIGGFALGGFVLLPPGGYADPLFLNNGQPVLVSSEASYGTSEKEVVAITISGRVTSSEDNSELPGVNVLVKGTTQGTVTDIEGKYQIDVPSSESVLVFSSIGFVSEEIAVGDQTVIDMVLVPDIKSLSEVVVVGYGTVKKSDVTGSVASVTAEELQEVPVQSISQALQGRAAGVDVSMSNFRPGEAPTIRIRGNRSLNATNNPLIVLDGIPLSEGSSINDFAPSDISSIEILKDASATAIYGSRGANGVILVTTKRGQAGKARITYDGYAGISGPLATLDMFDGAQHAELKREAFRNNSNPNDYTTPFPNPAQDYALFQQDPNMWESVAMGYEWEDEANLIPKYRPVTEEERERFAAYGMGTFDEVPVYHPERVRTTDWQDLVLRTGIKQNHQLSVSGGTEDLQVIFSGGYYSDRGIQYGQSFDRYNVRVGLDYQINDFIQIGGSSNGSFGDQDYGSDLYTRAAGQIPLAIPYDSAGNLIFQPGGDPLIFNPLFDIENVIDNRRTSRFMGSYYGDVTLTEGLRYRVNFGPDFRQYRRGQYYGSLSTARNLGTSQAIYDQEQRFNYVLENLLYYDKTFNERHAVGLTLLQSIQNERLESTNIQVSDLPYDSQLFYNLGSTNGSGADAFASNFSQKRLMSYMGRVNYTLNDRYLFTATGRFDGSSVLAEGHKWAFFPSFALAWKIQEEPFLSSVGAFDELKLRVGYGRTGNSAVDPYETQGALEKTKYVWGNNAAWGFIPDLIPNPNLKWEITSQINAGIDIGLLGGRISGSVDVYRASTSDLIMNRQIPTASGFESIQENIGATRNAGIEVAINSVNVSSLEGFQWSSNLIFTKNKEEIVELYGGTEDDIGNRWFIGYPVVTYYDWDITGVWQMDEAAEAAEYSRVPGKGKVRDVNNDKIIDDLDRVILGTNVPDWTGSLVNTFSYKNLELSVFFYARIGQTISSGYYRPSLAGRYPERVIDYWTPANPTNAYPRPTQDQERPDYPDAYLYTDGSFVKLRNVSLSYTMPASLTSRWGLENVNVYLTAYNPLLFTKFEAMDPEFYSSDPDVNDQIVSNNLSERSLVFGLRVGL